MCSAGPPGAGTMGCVTTSAGEYALADLAVRLGAARVAGWSPAEQDLATAAAALAAPAGAAGRDGRDCWDDRAGRSGKGGWGDGSGGKPGGRGDGTGWGGVAGFRARIRAGEDPLGEAFCRIRPPERRRGAGQTFTPAPVVGSMISWAGRALTPARVVDPGAGSARFLAAPGRRWPEAELVGLETVPLAARFGRSPRAARGMAGRAVIQVADYRAVRRPAAPGPTLFLGNPPYVRHHQVAAPWKDWFRDTAARLGLPASGLAGLHAHFFLATALHAAPGDAGALVTAAEWLDVNYGSLIRALLLGPLGGEPLPLRAPRGRALPAASPPPCSTPRRRCAPTPRPRRPSPASGPAASHVRYGYARWPRSPAWAGLPGGRRCRRTCCDPRPAGARWRHARPGRAAAPRAWWNSANCAGSAAAR